MNSVTWEGRRDAVYAVGTLAAINYYILVNQRTTIIIIPLLCLMSCKSMHINSAEECEVKEIKYLTTYIDSRMWSAMGGNSRIDIESAREMSKIGDDNLENAHFFIPMLLKEIGGIYSDELLETEERELIIEFSKVIGRIWKDETIIIQEGETETQVCAKVSATIDKYHQLSMDDKGFYRMIFTMDDGPFFGIDTEVELERIKEVSFDDKKLILRGREDENTLEVITKSGTLIWRKFMARSKEYKFRRLDFADDPIRVKNEMGYKVALYGDGELIQLYLKRNGEFRLFFHSW